MHPHHCCHDALLRHQGDRWMSSSAGDCIASLVFHPFRSVAPCRDLLSSWLGCDLAGVAGQT